MPQPENRRDEGTSSPRWQGRGKKTRASHNKTSQENKKLTVWYWAYKWASISWNQKTQPLLFFKILTLHHLSPAAVKKIDFPKWFTNLLWQYIDRWLSFLLKTQDRNNNPQQDSQLCLQGQAQPCTDSVYFSAFVFSILPLNRTWMSLKICFWRNAKYWQSLPSALEVGPVFHYLCSRKPCVSSGLSLSNFSFSLAFLTMLFSKVEDNAINMVPMSRSLCKNNHVISQSSTQEAGFQVK